MNYKELAKDILQLHTPDPQVILKLAREQQETLKKFDESFKDGVEVLAKAHAQLIAAQESEAVWKTVADKADQRRLEAESRLAEAEDLIKRGHDGWQKAEAEVERLRAEVTLYKGYTRGFGILHCAAYGEQHFGKKLLHPEHYDLLEKAGCRMDAYKKATLNPTSK